MKILYFIVYIGFGIEIAFRMLSYTSKVNPKMAVIAKKYKDFGGIMVVAAVLGMATAFVVKSLIDGSIWINEAAGLSLALLIIIKYWRSCAGYNK
jgi:hypothetical protein